MPVTVCPTCASCEWAIATWEDAYYHTPYTIITTYRGCKPRRTTITTSASSVMTAGLPWYRGSSGEYRPALAIDEDDPSSAVTLSPSGTRQVWLTKRGTLTTGVRATCPSQGHSLNLLRGTQSFVPFFTCCVGIRQFETPFTWLWMTKVGRPPRRMSG